MTCLYGDPGASYSYSSVTLEPLLWTKELLDIKERAEKYCKCNFNSVLCHLYRGGKEYINWHADDEKSLGEEPNIASFSFGTTRTFDMKHKTKTEFGIQHIELSHGDLLIMTGLTQKYWKHRVPQQKTKTGDRINLTFRYLYPADESTNKTESDSPKNG